MFASINKIIRIQIYKNGNSIVVNNFLAKGRPEGKTQIPSDTEIRPVQINEYPE